MAEGIGAQVKKGSEQSLGEGTVALWRQRVQGEAWQAPSLDHVAVEEPLEMRLVHGPLEHRQAMSLAITMRTPGQDQALALGFLLTEGIIQDRAEVLQVGHCGPALPSLGHSNVIKIELAPSVVVAVAQLSKHFYTTSSCGVCGKASIEALRNTNGHHRRLAASTQDEGPCFDPSVIHRLPERLRQAQAVFASTGGLHAAALFTADGSLLAVEEDVGRHNAVDKVLGLALQQGVLPLSQALLMVSGRISFELVQKAAMAGVPCLAAVGAPSSLAVALAQETNMSLLGFVRSHGFNVYCGEWRVRHAG